MNADTYETGPKNTCGAAAAAARGWAVTEVGYLGFGFAGRKETHERLEGMNGRLATRG